MTREELEQTLERCRKDYDAIISNAHPTRTNAHERWSLSKANKQNKILDKVLDKPSPTNVENKGKLLTNEKSKTGRKQMRSK